MNHSALHLREKNYAGLILSIVLFGVIVLAWNFQMQFLLNYDVSWLVHAAERLLQGGTYRHDFFEINPPLILYLYAPVIMIAHALTISIVLATRGYIFCLAGISLLLCWPLSRAIEFPEKPYVQQCFIVLLTAVVLFVPLDDFGQREHLALLFTLPYFLLIAARLTPVTIKPWFTGVIGLWASLGFFLKPFFLVPLILVEIFFFIKVDPRVKKLFPWQRPEIGGLCIVGVAYAAVIWKFHADYLSFVLPISRRFYFIGNQLPLGVLLKNYPVIYCGSVACLLLVQNFKTRLKPLTQCLSIAMVGFTLAHLLGKTNWYYHSIPCFSLALIVFVLLVNEQWHRQPQWLYRHLSLTFFAGLYFIVLPLMVMNEISKNVLHLDACYKQLIAFTQQHAAHEAVYFFEVIAKNAYPLVDYAPVTSASRFAALGWLRGLVKQAELPLSPEQKKQLLADQTFFMRMMVEDIEKQKPALIFINQAINFKLPSLSNQPFDLLSLFLQHEPFKTTWEGYEYFATINDYQVYRRV